MNKDYNILKKNYGEKFAKLCRKNFSTLLEKEKLLPTIILSKFAPNHYLYDDIIDQQYEEEFSNYIYNFVDVEKKGIEINKSVKELLSEAGYIFYECKTEEDIQSFKKYYIKDEELCTFNGGRLNRCYVFWAIKKNVSSIQRKNFKNPSREDEYGTSVISIQFTKLGNTLSIKNRYNHHVNNPDATFSNNLENIIPGLTNAFEREYGFKINQNSYYKYGFNLKNYTLADDGKWYRYNYELNNIFYCSHNIIIDNGEVKKMDPSRYIIIDYFVIDLKEKRIKLYDNDLEDSFLDEIENMERIKIHKNEEGKNIIIQSNNNKEIAIKTNKYGQITGISNQSVTQINDNFLQWNTTLTELNLPNLETINDWFMPNNKELLKLNLPNLTKVGYFFLISNEKLKEVNLPKIKSVGNYFLNKNEKMSKLIYAQLKDSINEDNKKKRH